MRDVERDKLFHTRLENRLRGLADKWKWDFLKFGFSRFGFTCVMLGLSFHLRNGNKKGGVPPLCRFGESPPIFICLYPIAAGRDD